MSFEAPAAFLLQMDILELMSHSVMVIVVLAILAGFSVFSWTVIFSKWHRSAGRARPTALSARVPQGSWAGSGDGGQRAVPPVAPGCGVRFRLRGSGAAGEGARRLNNRAALERALQLGVSEEIAKLERNMHWLATTASVSPFIGLLGTVLGIIRAFNALGKQGHTSLAAVGPGIAEALVATAVGLFAAIPAAMFYNLFGQHPRDGRAHGRFRPGISQHGGARLRRVAMAFSSNAAATVTLRGGAAAAAWRRSTSRRSWTWCWCCSSSSCSPPT